MGASFEESVIALKSMFPDVSEVVVRTTLEARDGHMESAVEKLLAMSRRGGGGHGGKDYGQSGLGAPGAMGMSPGSRIDNMGHLGGLLGGATCSFLFGPRLCANRFLGTVVDEPLLRLPQGPFTQRKAPGRRRRRR